MTDFAHLHELHASVCSLAYDKRFDDARQLLPWSVLEKSLPPLHLGVLPQSMQRCTVGLLSLRAYVLLGTPCSDKHERRLIAQHVELLAESEFLDPAESALMHLRAGQLAEATGMAHGSIDHYRAAAKQFDAAGATLDRAVALMLLSRSLRAMSPRGSQRAIEQAIHLLFRPTWHYRQTLTLYYIAHVWAAQTQARRVGWAKRAWHQALAWLATAPLVSRGMHVPHEAAAPGYLLPYVEPLGP
ncbi:MAG TPA: hypothetical protein VJM32_04720 [Candidatus Saccharimonadales bacterium]|nr:hypothetical protein [Candidatus Saccharimonadales bacterium]